MNRSIGHVERNHQSLAVSGRRRTLPDGQVVKVDVVVDRLEVVNEINLQYCVAGVTQQFLVLAGALLEK
jgi:hypothetical protein